MFSQPQPTIKQPDPEYQVKKRRSETRNGLKAEEMSFICSEFNISSATLRAMWSLKGQIQSHYGLEAVDYHTGETVVLIRKHKRRQEMAELLQTLLEKHPIGTVFVAWDNFVAHQDGEVEAVLRSAAGRLVLLYLPTYSPWLNPIEMLWRHFRQEVTHCELFEFVRVLIEASYDFFNRFNRTPEKVLLIIGAHPS